MAGLESRRAIVITGTVGSGKTTTMAALADLLEEHALSCAAIDMDMLRWFYPRQPGDRFGEAIGLKHLAMLAASYHDLGIATLVLADVIESDEGRAAIAAALGAHDLTIVRLDVPAHLLEQRLRQRQSDRSINWYLQRAPELTRIQHQAGIGDVVIDVGTRGAGEVAREIAARLQLL